MPKFNKPTPSKINTIWATNAVTGDVTEIDTSKIQQGWIQEKPPYESENWINQQHDQYIAYINQLGYPEWDQYTEYQNGKSYVQASNNLIYKCIQTHTNKNPATAGNGAFWEIWEGNRQATTSARGTTQYSTPNQTKQGTSTNTAVTPSSLFSYVLDGILLNISDIQETTTFTIPVSYSGSVVNFYMKIGIVVADNGEVVTFPTAFPNQCLNLQITDIAINSNSLSSPGYTNKTRTGFTLVSNIPTSDTISYFAIGY